MQKTINRVYFPECPVPKAIRVTAYARVSSGKDAMHHSLSAQVSYYSKLIQSHNGWICVGIYADEAKTGTKDSRENFQRLLSDCKNGKVDMVITKSISRLARNTITLLQTVRELRDLGIDVYFEEQNLHTMSGEGEFMLTILASYAQEESLSASENQKWRIRKNFQEGMPWKGAMLGYRYDHGKYRIIPEEAEIVQTIFHLYLSGLGIPAIMRHLKESGASTKLGNQWSRTGISKVLRNYTYTGNLLLQKVYRENHLTKRTIVNRGELPQYHATDTHPAIIDMDTFIMVQNEIQRRADKYNRYHGNSTIYPFSGKLVCAICGKKYRRKIRKNGAVWICSTYNALGKAYCASKQIPEEVLYETTADALELEEFDVPGLLVGRERDGTEGQPEAAFRGHGKGRNLVVDEQQTIAVGDVEVVGHHALAAVLQRFVVEGTEPGAV